MSAVSARGHVSVVGAGIVGVCCARWLQREGFEVTLLDRDEPGAATSYGNAGLVASVEQSLPLPSPALLRAVPGMLVDRDGPLIIRWRYLPTLLPWLRHMLAACSTGRRRAGARAMHTLLRDTTASYARLVAGSAAEDLLLRTGIVVVCASERSFESARAGHAILRELGVETQELAAHQIRQMEPALAPVPAGLLCPSAWRVTDPLAFTQRLVADFRREGGEVRKEAVRDIVVSGGRVRTLRTEAGERSVDRLLVSAGAWSHRLLRKAGLRVLLDTERGYHVQLPGFDSGLRRGVVHHDFSMALNQMRPGLRIAGTVEFAGLDAPPDYRRTRPILERGLGVLRDAGRIDESAVQRWMGFRPTLPDFLPALGPVPGLGNAWAAFAHQHLGLSLASVSGEVIARSVAGRDPGIDLSPFRVDRF